MSIPENFRDLVRSKYGKFINEKEALLILLKNNTMDELVAMSDIEINNLPDMTVAKFRALTVIGAKTDIIKKDRDNREHFRSGFMSSGSRVNLERTYKLYYIPLQNKFSRESMDSEDFDLEAFKTWATKFINNNRVKDLFIRVMKIHTTNQKVLELIESIVSFDIACELFESYKASYSLLMTKYNICKLNVNIAWLRPYLKDLSKIISLDNVASLDDSKALDFCRHSCDKRTIVISKIILLHSLGYTNIQHIDDEMDRVNNIIKLKDKLALKIKIVRVELDIIYTMMKILDLRTIKCAKVADIANLIKSHKEHIYAFRIVEYYLRKNKEKLQNVINLIPLKYTGYTVADEFCKDNPWRTSLVKLIYDTNIDRVKAKSSYVESVMKKLIYSSVVFLKYLDSYCSKNYPAIKTNDYIKWFLATCTKDMVMNVILEYGKTINVQNERVKNVVDGHHAKRNISTIVSLFKNTLKMVPCYREIHSIVPSTLTINIENKRVIADSNTRRVYLKKEIDDMLLCVNDDPYMTLIITILREIGLRAGAICNLKYRDLIDVNFNTPLHICRVLEKGNKIREFSTSPNLKLKIVTVIGSTIINNPSINPNWYIFGTSNEVPMSYSTFLNRLKKIAMESGIVDVNVHPHSFRHTIVGELMDAGNSAEIVSKYIGHTNVDTTMKYYHVMTTDDMMEKLINPYTFTQTKKEELSELETEVNNLNERLICALNIIDIQSSMLTECIKMGLSCDQYQSLINKRYPNYSLMIKAVGQSIADTNSVSSRIPSRFTHSTSSHIDPTDDIDTIDNFI
jgi:integrase